jgi:hypothetical protein
VFFPFALKSFLFSSTLFLPTHLTIRSLLCLQHTRTQSLLSQPFTIIKPYLINRRLKIIIVMMHRLSIFFTLLTLLTLTFAVAIDSSPKLRDLDILYPHRDCGTYSVYCGGTFLPPSLIYTTASILNATFTLPLFSLALIATAQMSRINAEILIEGMGEVDERGWDPAAHWEQIYEESNGICGASSLSLSRSIIFTAGLAMLVLSKALITAHR